MVRKDWHVNLFSLVETSLFIHPPFGCCINHLNAQAKQEEEKESNFSSQCPSYDTSC